ncbi:hypothetical protein M409DRAFT_24030 [Zasmidium cellare ATCC 36951]|uniref:Uncharacterized protein n=1 Tax=Zasmidium cellare ATCC 36951 TaxID=1080233 RepID=A0A6A6CIF7_ZASCE|nr:uncharacterized protein M409DRAFT_24030 [Zasmidium cellare ATCC 36951]KAF2165742.1 hypothetical protein M409DRAFT_24030 [Zasmidium cellare ATCC 36951]
MAPTLKQIFTIRLYRNKQDTLNLGAKSGSSMHIITPYSSGSLASLPASPSHPINATLTSGSSNSLHLDMNAVPAPTTHLDARIHFVDQKLNATFYIRFTGVARSDEHIDNILKGNPEARTTESREHYEFMQPVFAVSREEDRWMESTAWVGHGHYVVERDSEGEMDVAVEFEVYRLVTG